MATFDFIAWIKRVWEKLNQFLRVVVLVILAGIIDNFPRIFGEDVLLKIILRLLGNMWEGVRPSIIEYWLTKPYLFELTIFLIALFILILWAFIKTQPPKGIKIKWGIIDLWNMTNIMVENFSGYELKNCYLQVKNIVGFEKNKLPLNCRFIRKNNQIQEIIANKLTEVEHTKSIIFCGASPMEQTGEGRIVTWANPDLFTFNDTVKVEYQFGGTNPMGEAKIKTFEVTYCASKEKVEITRIWQ